MQKQSLRERHLFFFANVQKAVSFVSNISVEKVSNRTRQSYKTLVLIGAENIKFHRNISLNSLYLLDMENDPQMRQQIIDYIIANDKTLAVINFDNYTLTQLVIIKSKLEVKKYKFRK